LLTAPESPSVTWRTSGAATEEGIFAGTSTGANVVAALRVAHNHGRDATVVTIAVDSGLRYLSTDLYQP
jgi:cysteine synthase A